MVRERGKESQSLGPNMYQIQDRHNMHLFVIGWTRAEIARHFY